MQNPMLFSNLGMRRSAAGVGASGDGSAIAIAGALGIEAFAYGPYVLRDRTTPKCAKLGTGASLVHVRSRLCPRFFWCWAPKKEKKAVSCKKMRTSNYPSRPVPACWRWVCPPPSTTRIARRLLCGYIRPPMSVGGAGLARLKVTRKFVVGLFCGGAFHDEVIFHQKLNVFF